MMRAPPEGRPTQVGIFLTRSSLLFTVATSSLASLLALHPDFPFHPRLFWVAALSAAMHFGYFLAYYRIPPPGWNILNLADICLMGAGLHYTGGLLSPFIVILPIIFITGAGYMMDYTLSLAATLAVFIGVVLCEYSGWLRPLDITPERLYRAPWLTLLSMLSICGHMAIAAMIYKLTVLKLREKVAADAEKERALFAQMVRLDAKAQAGHLAAGLAHDVKGCLSPMLSFTDSIRTAKDMPPEVLDYARLAETELGRVELMLERMIKSAKPGGGRRERVRLRPLLDELVQIAAHLSKAKGIKFRRVFPEEGEIAVLADPAEIKRAYFNLLKNAVEALRCADGTRIVTVEMSAAGTAVSIEVADNGPGIPGEVLPRLFKDSVSGKEDGAGFGLLLVKEILDAYGGTVSIHSRPGLGTRVFTRLPLEVPA